VTDPDAGAPAPPAPIDADGGAAPPPEDRAPESGCSKDIDCKGDRICEGGRCVDPKPKKKQRRRD
jgi:hypothetical protein